MFMFKKNLAGYLSIKFIFLIYVPIQKGIQVSTEAETVNIDFIVSLGGDVSDGHNFLIIY